MIDMIYFKNGKIKSGFDTFDCDNKTDMEALCAKINEIISEQKIKNNRIHTQLIIETNNETELLVEAKKSNVDANTLTCIQGRINLLKNLKKCFHQ